jgi:hypothetical protein
MGKLSTAKKTVEGAGRSFQKGLDELRKSHRERMASAAEQGFDKDVYHGTHADIDEFDPSQVDIGTHVGSSEQATNRLKDTRNPFGGNRYGGDNYRTGANVMPVKMRSGKVLEMPDVGGWNDSEQVLAALEDMPEFRGRLDGAWEELGVKDEYGETLDWIEGPENREMLDEINSMLRADGYDTVKYKNAVENTYGDTGSYTDEYHKRRSPLELEYDRIKIAANDR